MGKFMKYALVNGTKTTPIPKGSGQCLLCDAAVISKCGPLKIWHWAHKNELQCDPWWENETPWHRDWKNKFPERCQEQIDYDEKGEKHIADVKTDEDWVIEFQHSYINPEERDSRNNFYKKLVWVVDGTRRKRDKAQFYKLIVRNFVISETPKILKVSLDDCTLLKEWSGGPWPVLFDFGEDNLWCLIPQSKCSWGAVIAIPRIFFISIHNRTDPEEEDFNGYLNGFKNIVQNYKHKLRNDSLLFNHFISGPFQRHKHQFYRRRFRRRF